MIITESHVDAKEIDAKVTNFDHTLKCVCRIPPGVKNIVTPQKRRFVRDLCPILVRGHALKR